jgi:hypothetical protein
VRFGLFYQLSGHAASRHPAQHYRELIAEAVEADRRGCDTVWLAAIAERTIRHFK